MLEIPDDLAERVRREALRRGMTPERLVEQLLSDLFPPETGGRDAGAKAGKARDLSAIAGTWKDADWVDEFLDEIGRVDPETDVDL